MGLFDMSPSDWISKVMDFSQKSLENTVGTVTDVHQALVEIPINIAQELGVPEEQCAALKKRHRQILDHVANGVCDACGEVNQYVVKQAGIVNELADFKPKRKEPKVLRLENNQDKRQGTGSG